jgi:hypothetical protein
MSIERHEGEGMTEFTIRRIRVEIIEQCASEIECTDWIIPLQGKADVDEFGKAVALIVLRQAAQQVRGLAVTSHHLSPQGETRE